jgi:2-keto-4-pentenoate hydratase/2-oxohepta-3-ene-1,7-dioic acid hydratase in catechol pathway
MRVCRYRYDGQVAAGFYDEKYVVPLAAAAAAFGEATGERLELPGGDCLLEVLPPDGKSFAAAKRVAEWVERAGDGLPAGARMPIEQVQMLVPIPRPNKLFLLAGNYADHIKEGGGMAAERAETIPYVFMKPPSTTLTDPGQPVEIPAVSPATTDWELELAVVIGRRGKGIKEADALNYVAGYTVINDISDRKFRPNPGRKQRPKDEFFDWLHGKWHDSFCPCGPCITSADAIADPQTLEMKLRVNGKVRQDATTGQQIFPVAAVIEFISSFVTLEPGDIISTGTPAGVGNTTGTYLKPGDKVEAFIGSIGTLVSPIVAEKS